MRENMQPLAWLTSLNIMFSTSMDLLAKTKFHSLWLNKIPHFLNPFMLLPPYWGILAVFIA
jgi:hypothetical protein